MPDTTVFVITQGDRLPYLTALLLQPDGTAQSLTGVSGVKFHMRPQGGAVLINAAASILDAPNGKVQYQWGVSDTATVGTYEYEFEVNFGGGVTMTFPNSGKRRLKIIGQIA